MKLLARANTDFNLLGILVYGGRNIADIHGRDLLYVDFAAFHIVKGMPYKLDALLQRNHETGHALVRDRQLPSLSSLDKEWNN